MRDALRAGIAIYNDGYVHAAHDAWEPRWLALDAGTDDERLLHGLIQFTAAVYHAHERNWAGCTGLAVSAREYLADLPETYRGVALETPRAFLERLGDDPALLERREPPALTHDGECVRLADLSFAETALAAPALADAFGLEETTLERAAHYARADLAAGDDGSRFITLLFDVVREDDARALVYQRLESHLERREAREGDVEGLF
ncbi:DUF309 domain-containing protein [Natronobiforma cellulositropha]|uniref:DUF309 domain-containing protein n=1 Tax=Natronobiforma cellulositropha TaxID=1679076 RepID=UPI0021D5DFC2|nr:DUF309 domain-containing protein [Natronobiforma cellulositropha]